MLVIWDIDLTLIDNAGFGHDEAARLLKARGIDWPADLTFAGRTDADIWGSVLGVQPGDPELGDFLIELADACAVAPWHGSRCRVCATWSRRWRGPGIRKPSCRETWPKPAG